MIYTYIFSDLCFVNLGLFFISYIPGDLTHARHVTECDTFELAAPDVYYSSIPDFDNFSI